MVPDSHALKTALRIKCLKRIVLTTASKPLEYTPKGTPRRAVCLALYAAEIEEVYRDERKGALVSEREFHDRI